MITWKIWLALERQHYSTLYHRLLKENHYFHRSNLQQLWENSQTQLGTFMLVALFLFLLSSGNWRIFSVLLQLLPIPLLISGTISGLLCAVNISRNMADELQRGRFDLVSITPFGAAGASWAICHQTYQDSKLLYHVKRAPLVLYAMMTVLVTFFLILMFILWLFLLSTGSADYEPREFASIWFAIIGMYTLLIGLLFDLIHSVTLGCVAGMMVSIYTKNVSDARGMAIALYLGVQITFYVLMAFFSFVLVPMFYQSIGQVPGVEAFVLRVGVFVVARELIIILLWRLLAQQLNASEYELGKAAGLAG